MMNIRTIQKDNSLINMETKLSFGFIYLAHARAVNNVSWRKTSKHMHKGSVSNMLVTSSIDKICRIWVQTVLPDDGLVNISQFDPLANQNPKLRFHRQKHRFMQRLKHMKACFHMRKGAKVFHMADSPNFLGQSKAGIYFKDSPVPTLPSSHSVHDFHCYGFHNNGISPTLHFHLAASVNANTDVPLVPSIQNFDNIDAEPNFVMYWMNNKEMHYTARAENLLSELLCQKNVEKGDTNAKTGVLETYTDNVDNNQMKKENITEENVEKLCASETKISITVETKTTLENFNNKNIPNSSSIHSIGFEGIEHVPDFIDSKIEGLLRDWHQAPDLLFAIHPIDGSFLIWVVNWLDDYPVESFRQAQISFSARIPNAFPVSDAISVIPNISLHNGNISRYSRDFHHFNYGKSTSCSSHNCYPKEEQDVYAIPTVYMVTNHINGTLNLWQLIFADESKFSKLSPPWNVWPRVDAAQSQAAASTSTQ